MRSRRTASTAIPRCFTACTRCTVTRACPKPRAGLSPGAGLLLSGIAHLHVLVATSKVQSLRGLERVVRHLGFEQARRDLPQRECIVVQALVPDNAEASRSGRALTLLRGSRTSSATTVSPRKSLRLVDPASWEGREGRGTRPRAAFSLPDWSSPGYGIPATEPDPQFGIPTRIERVFVTRLRSGTASCAARIVR